MPIGQSFILETLLLSPVFASQKLLWNLDAFSFLLFARCFLLFPSCFFAFCALLPAVSFLLFALCFCYLLPASYVLLFAFCLLCQSKWTLSFANRGSIYMPAMVKGSVLGFIALSVYSCFLLLAIYFFEFCCFFYSSVCHFCLK